MDDDPFLVVDFEKISKSQISDTIIEGLFAITKGKFDPDTVAENARRSLTHKAFYEYISSQLNDPSTDFTRFLLKENDIKHIRANAIEGYRSIAKAAFNDVFTSNVLKRLDITPTPPKSLPRADPPSESSSPQVQALPSVPVSTIVTTEAELDAFESVRRRLAFLSSGNNALFNSIEDVKFRDYQGKMVVFYKQERKGRLVDITEARDGTIRFWVNDGDENNPFMDLTLADGRLKALFERKIADF